MKQSDITEAVSVSTVAVNGLLGAVNGQTGLQGSQLKFSCGFLSANAATMLNTGGMIFFIWMRAAFETAPDAGATFDGMDAMRASLETLTPSSAAAIAVRNFAVRMALAVQARILAGTTFKSRQQIDRLFDRIDAAFNKAEIVAADNLDNVAYRALLQLHAAVSNDLANRARPLARMVNYTFPRSLPALALAQRIYTDGSRAGELIDENSPIHPLFMAKKITALSS